MTIYRHCTTPKYKLNSCRLVKKRWNFVLENKIVKTCKACGDLTEEQVYRRPNRPYIECRICMRKASRQSRLKHKEQRLKEDRIRLKTFRPISTTHLFCIKCKVDKDVNEFNKYMLNLTYPLCKICTRAQTKKSQSKPERKQKHKQWYNDVYEPLARNSYYKKQYGITLDEYNSLVAKQNNLCKICQKPERYSLRKDKKMFLTVDHCHSSGKIRGLLCAHCNRGIGHFFDDPSLLQMAIEYLKENSN